MVLNEKFCKSHCQRLKLDAKHICIKSKTAPGVLIAVHNVQADGIGDAIWKLNFSNIDCLYADKLHKQFIVENATATPRISKKEKTENEYESLIRSQCAPKMSKFPRLMPIIPEQIRKIPLDFSNVSHDSKEDERMFIIPL